jgi:putative membrane protein
VGALLLGLAQLAIAVVLSAIAAYLAFYLFQWFTRGLDEWEALRSGNAAVGLVVGALVVAVAIVLRPALVVNTTVWDIGREIYVRVLLAEAIQLAVGLVLALLAIALALYLFAALTRGIDEVAELAAGNLAVAGLLAGVVIGVALMVSQAVGEIMVLVSSYLF